jgi:hypothetical protein
VTAARPSLQTPQLQYFYLATASTSVIAIFDSSKIDKIQSGK